MAKKSDKDISRVSAFTRNLQHDEYGSGEAASEDQEEAPQRSHRVPSYHELNNRIDREEEQSEISEQMEFLEQQSRRIPTYHELTNRAENVYGSQNTMQQSQTQTMQEPEQQPNDQQQATEQSIEKETESSSQQSSEESDSSDTAKEKTGRLEVINWPDLVEKEDSAPQVKSAQATEQDLQQPQTPVDEEDQPKQEHVLTQERPIVQQQELFAENERLPLQAEQADTDPVEDTLDEKASSEKPEYVAPVLTTRYPQQQKTNQSAVVEPALKEQPEKQDEKKADQQRINALSGASSLKTTTLVSEKLKGKPQRSPGKEELKEKYEIIASFPEGTIRAKKPTAEIKQ